MSRSLLPVLLGATVLALVPPAVRAHGIESSLERFGGLSAGADFRRTAAGAPATRLQLESRFSSGVPASDAAVRLVPPDGGAPIEVGHTDGNGRLTFALPPRAGGDWELQVDAGPGHRDYLELPAATGTAGREQAHRDPFRRLTPPGSLGVVGLIGLIAGLGLHNRRRS